MYGACAFQWLGEIAQKKNIIPPSTTTTTTYDWPCTYDLACTYTSNTNYILYIYIYILHYIIYCRYIWQMRVSYIVDTQFHITVYIRASHDGIERMCVFGFCSVVVVVVVFVGVWNVKLFTVETHGRTTQAPYIYILINRQISRIRLIANVNKWTINELHEQVVNMTFMV